MNEYRIRATGELVDEAALRLRFDTVYPETLTLGHLDSMGADPVLIAPAPPAGRYTSVVRDGARQDALGNWVQNWKVVQWPEERAAAYQLETHAAMWEAIKQERTARKSGGTFALGHWFHSDTDSKQQWLGLKDTARDMLDVGADMDEVLTLRGKPVVWKTMAGDWVTVTIAVALAVVQAAKDTDAELHEAAERHYAAMVASPEPESYDFSSDWPRTYADSLIESSTE